EAHRELRVQLMREVEVGNWNDGVVEVGGVVQEIVGEAAFGGDRRDATGQVRTRKTSKPGGAEEDGRAVGAGTGRRDTGATHRAGIVLVDAKSLGCQGRGDERRGSGEKQQRK